MNKAKAAELNSLPENVAIGVVNAIKSSLEENEALSETERSEIGFIGLPVAATGISVPTCSDVAVSEKGLLTAKATAKWVSQRIYSDMRFIGAKISRRRCANGKKEIIFRFESLSDRPGSDKPKRLLHETSLSCLAKISDSFELEGFFFRILGCTYEELIQAVKKAAESEAVSKTSDTSAKVKRPTLNIVGWGAWGH